MKTAISIPDDLFKLAEKTAKRLGLSRSELYATALGEFLRLRSERAVTDGLDGVYSKEESALPKALAEAQAGHLTDEGW